MTLASSVFESIVKNSQDSVVVTDGNGDIVYWNEAAARLFGYSSQEVIGTHVHDILPTHDLRDRANSAFARFKVKGTGPLVGRSIQVTGLKKGGEKVHVQFGVNLVEIDGERFIYAFIRDISELMDLQNELEQQANSDALTGILNRRAFLRDASAAVSAAHRHGEPFAVLMLDIDHFKRVNDAHGHSGGDTALREFTRRIQAITRAEDIFGRVGGEEFCVALTRCNQEQALVIAEKIRGAIRTTPFELEDAQLQVTVSIGGASLVDSTDGTDDTDSLDAIQRRADDALYEAKRSGRDRVVFSAR